MDISIYILATQMLRFRKVEQLSHICDQLLRGQSGNPRPT